MRKRNDEGQYLLDPLSNKGRIYALIEAGESSRARMGELTGLDKEQVRTCLCNLVNDRRIEAYDVMMGKRNTVKVYRVMEKPVKPTFYGVNSVFSLGTMVNT